jgi:hypothetical protein
MTESLPPRKKHAPQKQLKTHLSSTKATSSDRFRHFMQLHLAQPLEPQTQVNLNGSRVYRRNMQRRRRPQPPLLL